MEELGILNAIALTLGAGAVATTVIPAIFRSFRAWKRDPEARQLEIHVNDHVFVVDPTSTEPTNNAELTKAISAIREATHIAT